MVSGPMLSAWLTPPIIPLLKIHVFNITNPDKVSIKLLKSMSALTFVLKH